MDSSDKKNPLNMPTPMKTPKMKTPMTTIHRRATRSVLTVLAAMILQISGAFAQLYDFSIYTSAEVITFTPDAGAAVLGTASDVTWNSLSGPFNTTTPGGVLNLFDSTGAPSTVTLTYPAYGAAPQTTDGFFFSGPVTGPQPAPATSGNLSSQFPFNTADVPHLWTFGGLNPTHTYTLVAYSPTRGGETARGFNISINGGTSSRLVGALGPNTYNSTESSPGVFDGNYIQLDGLTPTGAGDLAVNLFVSGGDLQFISWFSGFQLQDTSAIPEPQAAQFILLGGVALLLCVRRLKRVAKA